jgi:hypothetical protein
MPESVIQQHCWNHPVRGAVGRCPVCHRAFCRECVSEHESRLLCATCIKAAVASSARARVRRTGPVLFAAIAFASMLLAWATFFSLGQIIMESVTIADRSAWHDR